MEGSNYALVVLVTSIALVFVLVWLIVVVPQRRARQNQQQVVEDLKVGEEIVTVGGLVGKLIFLDREKDVARIEIAKGVEVRIIPAAISHPLDYVQRLRALERKGNPPR